MTLSIFGPSCTDLHILDAGILITVQQLKFMMFSLNMVDYPMSYLLLSTSPERFFWWTSRGDHSKTFLLLLYSFMLKSLEVGGL